MTKYYVESGSAFRFVLLAEDEVDAIIRALDRVSPREPLELANVFIVNQRGFVWDRDNHQLYGDECVLPTELLVEAAEADEYEDF